jgi:sugar phosphate isomerase/epimerase
MQRDVPATLARLAEIGYREVEFAGYFGRTPSDVRQLLERNGLSAPSTHVDYGALRTGWEQTVDQAAAVGHQFVTIPWIAAEDRRTLDGWRRVASEFNRAAQTAKGRGLRFAYHNHDFEFARVDGTVPFDVLIADTDPDLVSFELDIYWITKAGFDPRAYIRQHPTRFTMLHVKDSAGPPNHAMVDVGDGTIDFSSILRLDAEQKQTIKHAFVEHDQPADPMTFAKKSFDHLKALEY